MLSSHAPIITHLCKRSILPMNDKRSQRGQALILIVLGIVGLVAITALAIDAGNAFSDRRHAQNAADTAALAAALAKINGQDLSTAATNRATSNGYDGVTDNTVTVNNPPAAGCDGSNGPYAGNDEYIQVIIHSDVNTFFAPIVGIDQLHNCVEAIAMAKMGVNAAIFAGSQTCQNTIAWSGSNVSVIGGVHSNNDVKVGGSNNYVEGTLSYVSTVDPPNNPNKITYNPPPPANPVQTSPQDYPVSFAIDDYAPGGAEAIAAQSAYHYCACNKMDIGWLKDNNLYDEGTKTLQDGLYYTTGEVDLSASDIFGNAVTFVARDEISLSGSTHNLGPYVDRLLFFTDKKYTQAGGKQCNNAVVKISGSVHDWSGIIYAPNGLIEMSGSSNTTLAGTLIGFTVKLSGSVLNIHYDPNLLPSTLELAK